MELRHLKYFMAVVEHGGISRAANALHVAQPALTKQIHDLEEELGVTLFDRRPRGAELTAVGLQFSTDVRKILDDIAVMKERVRRASIGQIGSLSVGINVLHSWSSLISQILRAFRLQNPEVSIMLNQLLSGPQVEMIRSGELDAGFLFYRPPDDESLAGLLIDTETMLLAV